MTLRKIIVFGAGGDTVGHHIVHALAKDSAFHTTVLARQSSKTTYPASIDIVRVPEDYDYAALVKALRGQDAVICAGGLPVHDVQYRLIDAAIEAGVKFFIPSEWGMDNADPKNQDLCPIFKMKFDVSDYLRSKESPSFSWTAVACSIWLDWCVAVLAGQT
jgi:uncharacterized protein YbjT (DUF2867 family)